MTAWTGEAFSTSGNYYLSGDVTLNSEITIPSGVNVTLCLNGYAVIANTTDTSKFRIFHINGGTLTLCDCNGSGNGNGKLTGGDTRANDHGSAVYVEYGKFNMHGGKISGNTTTITGFGSGGGVYVGNNATFTMTGGEISDNKANYNGGGVLVGGSAVFTMAGGKIINNQTTLTHTFYGGGGVCVDSSKAKFTMSGGEISGNSTAGIGGGIRLSGPATLNGKVKITGNTKADSTETNNICLYSNYTITIGSNFSTDSPIGVHCSSSPTCTNFKNATGVCTEDIIGCFTADKDDEAVLWDAANNKIQLMKKHIFSGATTSTEPTCTTAGGETGDCTACNQESVTNPVYAPGHNWGEWSVDVAASCTAEGTEKRACQRNGCTETEIQSIPKKTDHNYVSEKCTVCGAVDPAHTVHIGGTATCVKKAVCEICEEEYGELGEHNWGEWQITAETCTVAGKKERSCTTVGCAEKETETIPQIAHTLTRVPEVPATETTDGTKEHWHCGGCGKNFLDENGETEAAESELKIGAGKIEKEVELGENAPTATLAASKEELFTAVLTDDDKTAIEAGKDIKIVLQIENQTQPAPEDKTAVETALGGLTNYTIGQYLDVNLFKVINGERTVITETKATLTITFEIPAALRGSRRTYSVIRVHDGVTTVLNDTDSDPNTITIETDKFSTYALVYSEKAASASGGSSSSDNGNAYHGSSDSSDKKTTSQNNTNPSANSGNPSTGVKISLVPLAAAVVVMATAVKRRKK